MTGIKGSLNSEVGQHRCVATVAEGELKFSCCRRFRSSRKTQTMALVLNHIAVTTTTPSFTRPIPSPVPFTYPVGNPSHRCRSEGNIFTYSNAYPIPHCIHTSGHVEVQSMDLLNSTESRLDSVILDDDSLTSLILEMELDRMNVLPELRVVNADLTDCSVVSTNRVQGS